MLLMLKNFRTVSGSFPSATKSGVLFGDNCFITDVLHVSNFDSFQSALIDQV